MVELIKAIVYLIGLSLSFLKGKNSTENKKNKEVVKNEKKFAKIKQNVSNMSDSELDAELQEWRDTRDSVK